MGTSVGLKQWTILRNCPIRWAGQCVFTFSSSVSVLATLVSVSASAATAVSVATTTTAVVISTATAAIVTTIVAIIFTISVLVFNFKRYCQKNKEEYVFFMVATMVVVSILPHVEDQIGNTQPTLIWTNLCSFHSLNIFVFNHINNFIGNTKIFNCWTANVTFVHSPEMITITWGTDNFLNKDYYSRMNHNNHDSLWVASSSNYRNWPNDHCMFLHFLIQPTSDD